MQPPSTSTKSDDNQHTAPTPTEPGHAGEEGGDDAAAEDVYQGVCMSRHHITRVSLDHENAVQNEERMGYVRYGMMCVVWCDMCCMDCSWCDVISLEYSTSSIVVCCLVVCWSYLVFVCFLFFVSVDGMDELSYDGGVGLFCGTGRIAAPRRGKYVYSDQVCGQCLYMCMCCMMLSYNDTFVCVHVMWNGWVYAPVCTYRVM